MNIVVQQEFTDNCSLGCLINNNKKYGKPVKTIQLIYLNRKGFYIYYNKSKKKSLLAVLFNKLFVDKVCKNNYIIICCLVNHSAYYTVVSTFCYNDDI